MRESRSQNAYNTRVSRALNRVLRLLMVARLQLQNLFSRKPVVSAGEPLSVDISLTTYGHRAAYVHLAIESIARGSHRPSRLILWLDDETLLADLTPALRRLMKRGLEVRISGNYGPHTKYLPYAMSESRSGRPLVTADDDCIYDKHWLKDLMNAFMRSPAMIHAHRSRSVTLHHNGELAPYLSWPSTTTTTPSPSVFFMGVGGVIYPPAFVAVMGSERWRFPETARNVDDIWLNLIALRNSVLAGQVRSTARDYPLIPFSQSTALSQNNLDAGGNDRVLSTLYSHADRRRLQQKDELTT